MRSLPVIRGRDGGFSAAFDGRSVWVFGDTPINTEGADGARWRSSTYAWTEISGLSHGITLRESLDANGAPGQFIPFTREERAYNAAHDQDTVAGHSPSRWRLWPGPIVVEPATGKAFVFYYKVLARNGPWAFDAVGQSIAVWDSVSRPLIRPSADSERRGESEVPLLFDADDAPPATGALAEHDSLYAFRCHQTGLTFPCILSRAAFADALARPKWEFYSGGGRWSSSWREAPTVLNGAAMLSVHWNAKLARYLAVYSTLLDNTIEMRTAPHLEGPWSPGRVIIHGQPPAVAGSWDYCGVAHAELAREDGGIEYVTYCRDLGDFRSEIRLVEVTFK